MAINVVGSKPIQRIASHNDRIPISVYTFFTIPSHHRWEVISWGFILYCFDIPVTISTSISTHSTVNASVLTHTYAKKVTADAKNQAFIANIVHVVSGMRILCKIYYEHYMCSIKKAKFNYKKSPFLGIVIIPYSAMLHQLKRYHPHQLLSGIYN